MVRHVFVILLVAVCLLQMSCGRPVTTGEAYRILSMERQFLLEATVLLERWQRPKADRLQLVEEATQLQSQHDQMLATLGTWLNWTGETQPQTVQGSATTDHLLVTLGTQLKWTNETQLKTSQRSITTGHLLAAQGTQLRWTNDAQPQTAQSGITTDHPLVTVGAHLNWINEVQPRGKQSAMSKEATLGLLGGSLPEILDQPPNKDREDRDAQHVSSAGLSGWTDGAMDQTTEAEAGPMAELVDLLRQEAPSAKDLHQLADEFRSIWASHKLRFDRFDADKEASDEE